MKTVRISAARTQSHDRTKCVMRWKGMEDEEKKKERGKRQWLDSINALYNTFIEAEQRFCNRMFLYTTKS